MQLDCCWLDHRIVFPISFESNLKKNSKNGGIVKMELNGLNIEFLLRSWLHCINHHLIIYSTHGFSKGKNGLQV